jgi:phosphatidylglycerophosphate synthase
VERSLTRSRTVGDAVAVAATGGVALLWTLGPGPAGWAAGLAWTAGLGLLVGRTAGPRLGPADLVTLARAVLGGGVAALVADGLAGWPADALLIAVLTVVALALDGVDGAVARRTGTASEWGARFDMETDAALLLVLSVHVAAAFGWWVLAIGLMRYAWVAAGALLPWLRGALPVRFSAKVVAAVQGVVLLAAVVRPGPLTAVAVAVALAALLWSFGVSARHLWARR